MKLTISKSKNATLYYVQKSISDKIECKIVQIPHQKLTSCCIYGYKPALTWRFFIFRTPKGASQYWQSSWCGRDGCAFD